MDTDGTTQPATRRRLGYLSGAPRVSTSSDTELQGPRSHVLGVMRGFTEVGWDVAPFVMGDRVPRVVRRSHRGNGASAVPLLTDLGRLVARQVSQVQAWHALSERVDWVYERLASFQSLGRRFHRAGVPWVLESNALLFEEAVSERKAVALASLARRIELAAYRECDVIVCVSEALAESVVSASSVERDKIVVVPNGVDTARFDPAAHAASGDGDFTIVFVGNLAPWQGLDTLLHAVAAVWTRERIRAHVVIAGDGPTRSQLEQLSRDLELTDRVRFLGKVPPDGVPAVIAASDIAYSGHIDLQGGEVFRSPLKLYEYMAMARPVLASSVRDARAIVGKRHGMLFSPGDVDELSAAIADAYRRRADLAAMGRAARAEVVAHHSWTARVRHLIASAEDILSARRPRATLHPEPV